MGSEHMNMTEEMIGHMEGYFPELLDLLMQLAQIPAPSNQEEKRAAFCRDWLARQGAEGVYIDEALNVVWPVGCCDDHDLVAFMAHSDVVFPEVEPLPLRVEDGRIHCPGIGDDTASVAVLMTVAKYIARTGIRPKDCGLLIVINSGEEGLGNLKGSRKIMEDFGSRIREFVTIDGHESMGVCKAVGSRRYRIEIDTEGGHSYGNFGNRNSIAYLASLINTLYTMKVPEKGKTTYNVGTVSGGTSVNTIAQHAEMLYEFRSDERESLAVMESHLNAALDFYRAKGIRVTATLVGDRPCGGNVDAKRHKMMMDRAREANRRYYGRDITFGSGSTDCNIPLSIGIPAICVGCYAGAGSHTREEWVAIDSLLPGLKFIFDLIMYHF